MLLALPVFEPRIRGNLELHHAPVTCCGTGIGLQELSAKFYPDSNTPGEECDMNGIESIGMQVHFLPESMENQ
jgi:hypothetical protein